ncbi:hypothetical protein FRC08_013806 [Ceratobasidium sp. 394]|nr:hypothetical protein FRC08_013806 [Ceratobasidium sp. 394]
MRFKRHAGPPPVRFLRPAVQAAMDRTLQPTGSRRKEVLKAAASCDLLLIVGVSLKCEDTYELIEEVAEVVHRRYGGVVYVDQQPIRGRNANHSIDFHLRVDVQEFSKLVMNAMDSKTPVDEDVEMSAGDDDETSDLWYEVSTRRVPPSLI